MRKCMPAIVLLVLILSFVTVVSAAHTNDTMESTDDSHSQESSVSTEKIVQEKNIEKKDNTQTSKSTNTSQGDDCCTAIIQGNNNDATVSFRRDSESQVTLNVTHNSSFIKQCKGSGSYFFHVLINKDGWIVGNGGTDSNTTNLGIQENALEMINKNMITTTNMNNIINLKTTSARGHFVIKSPNGTYSLFIKYNTTTYNESGILKPGQCLVVSNDPQYFQKGRYQNISGNNFVITSSRIIAAKDKYGVQRRDILTYSYRQNGTKANVKIYVCNDDGRYVNKSTGNLIDSIQTNTKYYPTTAIPSLDTWTLFDDINFTRKINTIVTSKDINARKPSVTLRATITDENGKAVNNGFVSFLFDNKTLKTSNGSVKYVNVTNGKVSLKHTIANFWKKTNHTYYVRYYGTSTYKANLGNVASVTENDVINLTSSHAEVTRFGTNLTITANITYKSDNTPIKTGIVLFKVNGKTIRNPDNSTYTINVRNGTVTFNLDLDEKYSAKEYKVTVVYGNGAFREESNTTVNIHKVPTDIKDINVTVEDNNVTVTGTFVDDNGNLIPYNSYTSVKIDGKTIKDGNNNTMTFNITNSVVNFTFPLRYSYKAGNHTLMLVIPELRETLGVRKNATMTIVKKLTS
ncbi:MAG: hypothetical protein BZ138_04195 [Methanosphaera sp. rholeuAM270]|nr:MAG: hypothetical protein BZ138_04195 [Methanosphaera sp. rholeuAM270]